MTCIDKLKYICLYHGEIFDFKLGTHLSDKSDVPLVLFNRCNASAVSGNKFDADSARSRE